MGPFYDWLGANRALFLWINGFHSPGWDRALLAVSGLADRDYFAIELAVLVLVAYGFPRLLALRGVAAACLGFLVLLAVLPVIKYGVAAPRPVAVLGRAATLVEGAAGHGFSFPSGHASLAFLMAAALTPGAAMPLRILLWLAAVAVALARVALGAHFPADVAGGAVLGIVLAVLARQVLRLRR
jgi:undecaprenyl-diphosphatase